MSVPTTCSAAMQQASYQLTPLQVLMGQERAQSREQVSFGAQGCLVILNSSGAHAKIFKFFFFNLKTEAENPDGVSISQLGHV